LHMAQLMPLPLTVSCFSKIQIGFTFLVPADLGSPEKGPLNACVCVALYCHVLSWSWLPVTGTLWSVTRVNFVPKLKNKTPLCISVTKQSHIGAFCFPVLPVLLQHLLFILHIANVLIFFVTSYFYIIVQQQRYRFISLVIYSAPILLMRGQTNYSLKMVMVWQFCWLWFISGWFLFGKTMEDGWLRRLYSSCWHISDAVEILKNLSSFKHIIIQ